MIKKVFICVDIIKQQRLAGDIMGGRVLELETAQEHYQRWLKEQKNK